jgi:hypothetical protein
MPNPIDNAFINAQFKNFVDFARNADAGTKVRTTIGNDGPLHTIAAKSESVLNKIFFRTRSNKSVNNEVRTLFRQSVARMFGGEEHIPAAVKSAMKMGDFGKGRPLTARRILAVQSALEQIAAKHDAFLQDGLNYYGDRDNGRGATLVKLAFSSCHGNADAMEIVDKHLGSIIQSGDGELRTDQAVQKRIEGMVKNLEQLKSLSRKNPVVYAAGKQMLSSIGKPLPRDLLAALVQAANRLPLNLLRRLDGGSTGMQIHTALRQFLDTIQAALDSTGATNRFAETPEAKTAAREFLCMIALSRCSSSALGHIRDAINAPTTAHLARLYNRWGNGEADGVPADVGAETRAGLRDTAQLAFNFLEMMAFCVQENLARTAPGAEPVEIGECNGIPDLPALGGDELVQDALASARALNARSVEEYVNATVKGRSPAADECKRLLRTKLGEANQPGEKLGLRLGANAMAMMNITICGEMQRLSQGKTSQFEKDIDRGINCTLRDGNKTIKLSADFATARDDLARFVTGDDNARYDTLQRPDRNKVHLLMSLLSQETEKAGENGSQYAVNPRESCPVFNLGTPPRGTGRTVRTFTIEKRADGGINLDYDMDKEINSFQASDRPGEDHSLATESNFQCKLRYRLTGTEYERVAGLDYAPYDDDRVSAALNESEDLPDGTHDYKAKAMFRAVGSMPEQFKINAECLLDFELNLVPAADD